MRITDLNAPGGIGANCLLIELDGFNVVIDSGIHPKEQGEAALPRFDLLRGKDIDLIFVTHCHLDHLGALPVLARDHPEVPIIMSEDSAVFYKRLLKNSCTVMARQMEESKGRVYPLYGYNDIAAASHKVTPTKVGMTRHYNSLNGDRLTFTLYAAGHIPGCTGVLLEHRQRRIFHTSDVLFNATPMLDGARFPESDMDVVVLETTRGMTERPLGTDRESETQRLLTDMCATLRGGGSVLVPVFALGRMQELLTVLRTAKARGDLPRCPIYVSGLGIDLLNAFDKIAHSGGQLRVRKSYLRDLKAEKFPAKHRAGRHGPAIYLLSSGMMVQNTPSYLAASDLLEHPASLIAFTGYCDPDTPGGQLLAAHATGKPKFNFKALNKCVKMAARIDKYDLSSHADREELVDFAIARNPKAIVLTHGDPPARAWIAAEIQRRAPGCKVIDPVPLTSTLV